MQVAAVEQASGDVHGMFDFLISACHTWEIHFLDAQVGPMQCIAGM